MEKKFNLFGLRGTEFIWSLKKKDLTSKQLYKQGNRWDNLNNKVTNVLYNFLTSLAVPLTPTPI